MSEFRRRIQKEVPELDAGAGVKLSVNDGDAHPSGRKGYGIVMQVLLLLAFFFYFNFACVAIHTVQLIGWPLYFINKDTYYAYMSFTKVQFGLVVNTITQWFSPTTVRISGDDSVKGQLKVTPDARLECDFPERMIMMANHQIYTDWLYLWWISYTSHLHGHIFIILKESLKYVPFIGPGMMFFGFIFMARNWEKDMPRMRHRLSKLNAQQSGLRSGSSRLDPLLLLIFPEGTNLSKNGRNSSRKFAEKVGIQDMQHQLLPRSRGLQFCLQELRTTVDWVYDCTIAYEGIPRGEYGQDVYTLRGIYFQGRAPPSVNMYWRRFAVSSIPLDDSEAFEQWVRDRWTEKDQLLERFVQTGRFPALAEDQKAAKATDGKTTTVDGTWIETEVKNSNSLEFLLIFLPFGGCLVLYFLLRRAWQHLLAYVF